MHEVSVQPTRRTLIGAATAVAAVPLLAQAAAPRPGADEELVAIGREAAPLAAEFDRNLKAFFNLPIGHPDLCRVGELNDEPDARLDVLTHRALELDARTMSGFIAKAHLLRHHLLMQCGEFDADGQVELELAMSLVNDLLAVGVA